MTFLAPTALFGVLLLAIPIIAHLFKPRKMRATPFSSLRWLKQAHQRLSRRIQWHQWLLFLLRAGVVVFLVLALAKPLVGLSTQQSQTDRILLLDTSRSMAYKTPTLPSPWESARELAGKLLSQPQPGQRSAVLLTDVKTRVLRPLVADASSALPILNDMQPGSADTNLGSALPVIEGLLRNHDKGRPVELVVFTDHQSGSWQQPDIRKFVQKLERPMKIQVVDVGLGTPTNAWIAGARLVSEGSDQDRVLVVEVGSVGDQGQARSVRLSGITGSTEETLPLSLEPGKINRVGFRIPADLPLLRQIAKIRLDPSDNLPSDDVWYLPLDASDKTRVLLIESETPGQDGRPAGLFLRTGLQALESANKGSVEVQMRTPALVTVPDVRQADLVILVGGAELPDTVVSSLEAQVRTGTGLVVFTGPGHATGFWNDRLYRALQPAEGLVSLAQAGEAPHRPQQPSPLVHVRWQHPILASLNDPVLGDLSLGNFRQYVRFKGEADKNDQVLAQFEDGTPALVEHALGAGRVLVCNTSANDDWTDLPRRQSFVPFLDRLLTYLARGGLTRPRTVGEPVTLALTGWPLDVPLQVVSPSDKKWVPPIRKRQDYPLVHFDQLLEPGVYRVEATDGSDRSLRFVANVGRNDSQLSPMDSKVFSEWWDPVPVEVLTAEEAARAFDGSSWSWPLWPFLVVLVGLLLMAETMYACWLCPRRNQTLAESVVHERGLFRPLVEKEA